MCEVIARIGPGGSSVYPFPIKSIPGLQEAGNRNGHVVSGRGKDIVTRRLPGKREVFTDPERIDEQVPLRFQINRAQVFMFEHPVGGTIGMGKAEPCQVV